MRWLVTSIAISTELVESKFAERLKKDLVILKSKTLAKRSSHSMRILPMLQDVFN